MCERPLPLTAGPAAQTRVTMHHAWGQDGHPHICPHRRGLGRHSAGADGCQGGYGGHNGRMWSIVLAHGVMERGLPEANVMASHM